MSRLSEYFSFGDEIIHDTDEVGSSTTWDEQVDIFDQAFQEIADAQGWEYDDSRIGWTIGATIAGGLYVWTYPVTWLDGPLPIIDVAWAWGFSKAVRAGGKYGSIGGGLLGLS